MPNIELRPLKRVSTFRKIALGTWRTTYDPSVYGSLRLRMDRALEYIQAFREKTGLRLTVTQMMAKALAAAYTEMPDANAILRYGRLYLRQSVDIGFQVAMTEGEGADEKLDLSAVILRDIQKKTLSDLVTEMDEKVGKVRRRQDKELEKARGTFGVMPYSLVYWALRFVSFVSYTLNLDLRWAGLPKDPFGSAMITNIGALGLESGYVPLVPYSRCPMLIALGAVQDEPVIEGGAVVPGKVMRIFATFDHRVMDGAHAAIMSRVLRKWMENPFEHFDAI